MRLQILVFLVRKGKIKYGIRRRTALWMVVKRNESEKWMKS